jgi:predicted PurR-regulated permease PerM
MENDMSAEGNKVHKLETVKSGESAECERQIAGEAETNKDMSKVAIVVSLLVVVLLVIFFFGMNRNIAGLTEEVKSLGEMRNDISTLDQRMVQMEEGVPVQMKKLLAHGMVNEMAMKAAYLGNTLEDQQLRDRMQEILQSLKEVRGELEK